MLAELLVKLPLFVRRRDLSAARSFELINFLFLQVLRDLREVTKWLILAEQDRKGEARLRQRKLSSRLRPQGCLTP